MIATQILEAMKKALRDATSENVDAVSRKTASALEIMCQKEGYKQSEILEIRNVVAEIGGDVTIFQQMLEMTKMDNIPLHPTV